MKAKIPDDDEHPIVWGYVAIARVINRNPRQTHHLLNHGKIISAKKVGGLTGSLVGCALRESARSMRWSHERANH